MIAASTQRTARRRRPGALTCIATLSAALDCAAVTLVFKNLSITHHWPLTVLTVLSTIVSLYVVYFLLCAECRSR